MKNTKQSAQRFAKGFTLMEMLLVLAIIGLLVGMGSYMMVNVVGDAEYTKVDADIMTLKSNLIRYKTKAGLYPSTEQGLNALAVKPSDGPQPKRWSQLTKEAALYDPFGNLYQYKYPGTHNPETYDIWSIGKDGKDGTDDDIGNW